MSSQLTHDIVATIGEYTDRQTGQKKKRYLTCGKCFTDPEGRQSIKIDAIPGPGWSGWLSLYPVEKPQQSRPPATTSAPPAAASSAPQEEEEIPF
jgi:hypothetical protein